MLFSNILLALATVTLCLQVDARGNEKCKDLFNKSGGSNICVKQGYVRPKSSNFRCDGDCNVQQCCQGQATCVAYFIDNGKSMCTDNGYRHRRNHSTKCSTKGKCEIDDCCKNKIVTTCKDFFGKQDSVTKCKTEGFLRANRATTQCADKTCQPTECCRHRPEIRKVQVDCKRNKSCLLVIRGSGFGQKCTVPVHAFTWQPPEALVTITNAVCTPNVVHVQIPRRVAARNEKVNILVSNTAEDTWAQPVVVELK